MNVPICVPLPFRVPKVTEAITEAHRFLTGQPPDENRLTEWDEYIDHEMIEPYLRSGLPMPFECLILGTEYVLARTACQVGSFFLFGQAEPRRDSTDMEISTRSKTD
jgi:hypothetical protein